MMRPEPEQTKQAPPERMTYWSGPHDQSPLAVRLALIAVVAAGSLILAGLAFTVFILLVHGW
jgi:hypothetical protein